MAARSPARMVWNPIIASPSRNRAAARDLDARVLHLFDGSPHVAGMELHTAAAVLDDVRGEAEGGGVERGELHAVVGGQAEDVDVGDALLAKEIAEARGVAMTVVEEAAV